MGLFDLAFLVWRRRWLIGATGLAFAFASAVVALLMTPTYRAEVLLVPVESQQGLGGLSSLVGQLGGLASLAGLSLSGSDQTAEAIAVLRSRALTEQFIRESDLLPVLFPDAWDADRKSWKSSTAEPTMGDALLVFDRSVRSVRPDLQSGLVTLRIDWRDREMAASWANQLVRMANEALRQRAIEEADRSLDYLGKVLSETTNVELRTAVATLMQNQLQVRTFASIRQDYAFRVVDPAVPSDLDKRIRPQRTLITLVGLFGGLMLAILVMAFAEYVRNARLPPHATRS